jgi:hypothetical protein
MSKQTSLEGKWKDSKDIGQGGGRAYFDLRLGDQTNVIRIFCLLCVVMALLLSIMISGLYEGSLANLGEIEAFMQGSLFLIQHSTWSEPFPLASQHTQHLLFVAVL